MAVLDLPDLLGPLGVTLPTDMETMIVINCDPIELKARIANAVASAPKDWIGAPTPVESREDSPIFQSLYRWVEDSQHMLIPLLLTVTCDADQAAANQHELRTSTCASLLKYMLEVEDIQLIIAQFMNAILMGVFSPFENHPPPSFIIPKLHIMCINQLRWLGLGTIRDPHTFADIMLDALVNAELDVRADLLVALSGIIPPAAHGPVVELIIGNLSDYVHGDLLGPSIESLSNLVVPEHLVPGMIREVAGLLPGIKDDKVPLVVRFLLEHSAPSDSSSLARTGAGSSKAGSKSTGGSLRDLFPRGGRTLNATQRPRTTQPQPTQQRAPPLDPVKECLDMLSLSGMEPSSIALTMDEFIAAMSQHKTIAQTILQTVFDWLRDKCAAGAGDAEGGILPLTDREWVLLVALGSVPSSGAKKMRELVLSNIKAGRLTPTVVSHLMAEYAQALDAKHGVLLELVEALIGVTSMFPGAFGGGFGGGGGGSSASASSAGGVFSRVPKSAALITAGSASHFSDDQTTSSTGVLSMLSPPANLTAPTPAMAIGAQLLYSGLAHFSVASRQDWVFKCVQLIGTGGVSGVLQTDIAMRALLAIATSSRAIATRLEPFAMFLRSTLESLNALSLYHVSMYFDIAARLGFASASRLTSVSSPLVSDLDILARKFVGRSHPRTNAMGVLASLAIVERYADPSAPWMAPLEGDHVSEQDLLAWQHEFERAVEVARTQLGEVIELVKDKPRMLAVMFDRLAHVIASGGMHTSMVEAIVSARDAILSFCSKQPAAQASEASSSCVSAEPASRLTYVLTTSPSGEAVIVDAVECQGSASASQLAVDVDMLTEDPNHCLYFTSEACEALPSLFRCFNAIAARFPAESTLGFVADLASRSIHFSSAHGPALMAHLRLVSNVLAARAQDGDPATTDALVAHWKRTKAVEAFLFAQHGEQAALLEAAQAKAKEIEDAMVLQSGSAKKGKGKSKGSGGGVDKGTGEPPKKRGRVPKADKAGDSGDSSDTGPASWLLAIRSQWPLLPIAYKAMSHIAEADRQLFHYVLVDFYDWMQSPRRAEASFATKATTRTNEPIVIQAAATGCPLPVDVATELASCWLSWLLKLAQACDRGATDEIKEEDTEADESFNAAGDITSDTITPSSSSRRESLAPGDSMTQKAEKKAAGAGKKSTTARRSKSVKDTVELIIASLLRLFTLTDDAGVLDAIIARLSNTARHLHTVNNDEEEDEMDVDKSIDLGASTQPGSPLLLDGIEYMDTGHPLAFSLSQPNLESDSAILQLIDFLIGFVTMWTPAAAVLLYQVMVRLTTMRNDCSDPTPRAHVKGTRTNAGKPATATVPERFHDKLYTAASSFLSHKWERYEEKSNHDAIEYFVEAQVKYSDKPIDLLSNIVDSLVYVAKSGDQDDDGDDAHMPTTQALDQTVLLNRHTILPFFKTSLRQSAILLAQIKFEGDDVQYARELKDLGVLFEKLMDISTTQSESFVRPTIIDGGKFIISFNAHVSPVLDDRFPTNPDIYNAAIRRIHKGSKILQRVCGHAKVLTKASLISPVPKTRHAIEKFVQTIHQLNVASGLGDEVESGTTKHRTLDGEPAPTQVYRGSQTAEESYDEAEYDPKPDSARATSKAKGKGKAKAAGTVASPGKGKAKPGSASAGRKRSHSEVDAEAEDDGSASSSSASSRLSSGSRPSVDRAVAMGPPRLSAERRAALDRARVAKASDEEVEDDDIERNEGEDEGKIPMRLELDDDDSETDERSGVEEEEDEPGGWVLTQVVGEPWSARKKLASGSLGAQVRSRVAGMPLPSSTQRMSAVGGGLSRSGSRGAFQAPLRKSGMTRAPATKANPKSAEFVQDSDDDGEEEDDRDGDELEEEDDE